MRIGLEVAESTDKWHLIFMEFENYDDYLLKCNKFDTLDDLENFLSMKDRDFVDSCLIIKGTEKKIKIIGEKIRYEVEK